MMSGIPNTCHSRLSALFVVFIVLSAGCLGVSREGAKSTDNITAGGENGRIDNIQKPKRMFSGSDNEPTCGNETFTVPPLEKGTYDYIDPLGHLNPPDHTIPTDHIYFMLKRDLPLEGGRGTSIAASVKSPGEVVIYSISESSYLKDGKKINSDYSIEFSLCKEVKGKFGHVSELSVALKNLIKEGGNCNEYPIGSVGDTARMCRSDIKYSAKAGEVIGTAGGKVSAALDMWVFDSRIPNPAFANPQRYHAIYAVCPISYFSKEATEKLNYLGSYAGPRTIEPQCGEINQDKKGTLQGNWFYGDAVDGPDGWPKSLALVHDNSNPIMGVVSVGGVISKPGTWHFTPAHSGEVNREFGEVTPSETVYCYESEKSTERFLIQLVDETALKIEKQDGKCGLNAFVDPKTYER
ncbi:MAG: hypothetical protein HZB68_03430 [Candidatus Aenigmarchaeota archaeon]|nr:hypothetical protein [Candidatus Aenigmarchaeota archaeon]